MKTITLAAPVTRSPAVSAQISQVLLSYVVRNTAGAVVLATVLPVEDKLSAGCLAELEALVSGSAKGQVEAAEAPPPAPPVTPEPKRLET